MTKTTARPDAELADTDSAAVETLHAIGTRIRSLRSRGNLTLQELGEMTGLSASMLSLVERGKTSPSIGTLVAISYALGVHMRDLVSGDRPSEPDPVSRREEQPEFHTPSGVRRRVLRDDRQRGLEVAVNEYAPGTSSAERPLHHEGFEYGVLIEGKLVVQIGDEEYQLRPGDLVSYNSGVPHRISNPGKRMARALWVNLDRAE
ncbi:MAG TPA: cupin domain-containing protein [Acidimicrobiia bacterium]|jgi:transcriptional regulator with XRE-family HTH domain|nr:cupin domain-containing protein [Acidimicrobiia bacterium]